MVNIIEDINIDLGEIGKFVGRYSLGRDDGMDSLHFLRIKIPAGRIDADRIFEIADLAKEYGRGYAEVTDRQDIQLHWIDSERAIEIFERLYKLGYTTDLCGQGFSGACHGDVRNIVACPLSGKINDFDVAKYAIELTEFFSGNPDYLDLPRKFKIAFTACENDCVRAAINDLAMIGVEKDGERGFTTLIGGGLGASYPGPSLARHMPVFVPEDYVFEFVKAVVEVHRDYGSRESKAKARFKNLVASWGVEKVRKVVEEKIGNLEDFKELPDLGQDFHSGTGKQMNGLYYFTLPLVGGVLDADKLDLIGELAEKYGSGEVRLTTTQNIIFVDIEDIEGLKNELSKHFRIYDSKAHYNSIACASDFCGKNNAKGLLNELLKIVEKHGIKDDVRFYISGCPNACGNHQLAHFGFVGRRIKKNGKVVQGYDLYIGGSGLRMAKLYKKSLTPDEVLEELDTLLRSYRQFKDQNGGTLEEFLEKSVEVVNNGGAQA